MNSVRLRVVGLHRFCIRIFLVQKPGKPMRRARGGTLSTDRLLVRSGLGHGAHGRHGRGIESEFLFSCFMEEQYPCLPRLPCPIISPGSPAISVVVFPAVGPCGMLIQTPTTSHRGGTFPQTACWYGRIWDTEHTDDTEGGIESEFLF